MSEHDDLEQKIRERAFELWIEDGQPSGKAEEHWERARADIAAEKDQPPSDNGVTPPIGTSFGP